MDGLGISVLPLDQWVRLKLSPQRLFEVGINVGLIGEAGAGKSTTLAHYVSIAANESVTERIVISASLGRLTKLVPEDAVARGPLEALLTCLALHCSQVVEGLGPQDVRGLLCSRSSLLVLDGVDEAWEHVSWLLPALDELASQFPKAQVIVSSRPLPTSLGLPRFVCLGLLPFTKSQQLSFIRNWFGDDGERAEDVLAHLRREPELDAVVKNPLLATVLCVLREHDIELPKKEVRLYEERMRLLAGEYDRYKGIARRTKTTARELIRVARKVAFQMHTRGLREAPTDDVLGWISQEVGDEKSQLLLSELVAPCEILLPAPPGALTFGHLRFQEYLAAEEIAANRNIKPVALALQPWWSGAMLLLAQEDEPIDWVLEMPESYSSFTDATAILLSNMLAKRPEGERERLLPVLAKRVAMWERWASAKGVYRMNASLLARGKLVELAPMEQE